MVFSNFSSYKLRSRLSQKIESNKTLMQKLSKSIDNTDKDIKKIYNLYKMVGYDYQRSNEFRARHHSVLEKSLTLQEDCQFILQNKNLKIEMMNSTNQHNDIMTQHHLEESFLIKK